MIKIEFERSKTQTYITQTSDETKGTFSQNSISLLLFLNLTPLFFLEIEARSEKLRNEKQNLISQINEISSKKELYKSLQDKTNANVKRSDFFFSKSSNTRILL